LAAGIDKERELVVFWVSPRQRARQSAEILREVFEQQGIIVIRDIKTVKSLMDTKLSPEFLKEFSESGAIGNWMEYWTESELSENTEKPEEVKQRVQRIITYLERIARTITLTRQQKTSFHLCRTRGDLSGYS